ncbi:LOW QUALITY PROTEIN: mitochondrial sodium/calcium exchanger protein [Drosophila eugracilis]|uniref:LOW QUALITY PROTEIN: mitochondrial sodium/calcium exchanger protein n=1 Tax=Drosophila eugracilis TaxID=29029 RepID=UPI0007E75072|nr:LOW QUALITY PROTEIN: mitochondrial sodium/calcium exchanger protein [Drosophila eugracilis]
MGDKESVVYIKNAMDAEFDSFWEKVSCYAAKTFPFEERCEFVKKAKDCNQTVLVLPYMKILACDLNCVNAFEEIVFFTMFVGFCFVLLVLLIHVCDKYYSPTLKSVSKFLRMNEHLAGVTLLAFGNSSADMFSNLAGIRDDGPVFGNTLAGALFVSMVSGGLICYISPFKMNAYESVRDILFLILGANLLSYFLETDSHVSQTEFIIMYLVYLFYIIVNVADVYLIRRALKTTNRQIDELHIALLQWSPEKRKRLSELEKQQGAYTRDVEVEIFEKTQSGPNINKIRFTTSRMAKTRRVTLNRNTTRIILLSDMHGKNWGIWKDFFLALRPIKCAKWQKADLLQRALMLIQLPGVFLCSIYIPLVNYELDKHGWNKLLNCLQVMLNPALSIIVIKAFLVSTTGKSLWYTNITEGYKYAIYSLAFTVPFAIFMFVQSRTDVPPFYHSALTALNLSGSMIMIFVCATEIDKAMEVIGFIMGVDNDFMGATVKASTGYLGHIIANMSMALHGYPKMAYASAIGGPFFTLVLSTSLVLHIKTRLFNNITPSNQFGNYGENAFIFLNLGLFLTLLWSTTLGFFARRSVGIFGIVLYSIYLIFAMLIHWNIIHSFSNDAAVKAGFGDI